MPRMAETEARRPHPIARRRACQDSFRERRGDSAQTEDIVCEIRSTYGGGASAKRVMFRELVAGMGYSEGQEKDWMMRYVSVWNEVRRVAKGCTEAGTWFRRVE